MKNLEIYNKIEEILDIYYVDILSKAEIKLLISELVANAKIEMKK